MLSGNFKIMVRNQGFTLIEVIVVLIILGLLASLGINGLFTNIEASRSAEALPILKILGNQAEICATTGAGCSIDIASYDTAHFRFTRVSFDDGQPGYLILAVRNGVDEGYTSNGSYSVDCGIGLTAMVNFATHTSGIASSNGSASVSWRLPATMGSGMIVMCGYNGAHTLSGYGLFSSLSG
jgi:prepilin-type N-terminal cleavage/methylation domain-containing protein